MGLPLTWLGAIEDTGRKHARDDYRRNNIERGITHGHKLFFVRFKTHRNHKSYGAHDAKRKINDKNFLVKRHMFIRARETYLIPETLPQCQRSRGMWTRGWILPRSV
mgnify:CR=1 FL=1